MINILGVNISNVNTDSAVSKSLELLDKEGKHLVFTPNSNLAVKAIEDKNFAEVLNSSSLSVPDGMPLVLISRFFGTPLQQKVSGSSYFINSLRAFAEKGHSIYFFGGKEQVLKKVVNRIKSEVPDVKIQGFYSPPMYFERSDVTLAESLSVLRQNPADVLYVAASGGRGEEFLAKHIEMIPFKVAIQVGAAFDFYSGEAKPMPDFMKKAGLGWLFRMMISPKRMFQRYFLHDIRIFKYAFKHKINQK